MKRAYFIAATGTDLGKTLFAECLLRQARQAGATVEVCKPVASGMDLEGLSASDSSRLLEAAGLPVSAANLDNITPWRYAAPHSPEIAARLEGRLANFAHVLSHCQAMMEKKADLTLIEGAGGVLSPLCEGKLNLDLAVRLRLPVILVASCALGTISQTLTALESMQKRNIFCAALVLNQRDASEQEAGIVLQSLQPFLPSGLPVLTMLPLEKVGGVWNTSQNYWQHLTSRA